jgi:hypothetical protein
MAWWVRVAGTGRHAYTQERWDERRASVARDGWGLAMFAKRPSVRAGDRMVVYAAGSASEYGEGRFIGVDEVLSDEPEPSGHERWRWQMRTRPVLWIEDMSRAPALRDIGVSPKSLRQHSHILLTEAQGLKAVELLRQANGHLEDTRPRKPTHSG